MLYIRYLLIVLIWTFVYSPLYTQNWRPLDNATQDAAYTTEILENNSDCYKMRVTIHGLYEEILSKNQINYHLLSLGNDAFLSNLG